MRLSKHSLQVVTGKTKKLSKFITTPQVKNLETEGYIQKKMERRLDKCIK